MKKNKKIIILLLITLSLNNVILYLPKVNAAEEPISIEIYSEYDCDDVLTYNGETVKNKYIVHKTSTGMKYPAYCLQFDKRQLDTLKILKNSGLLNNEKVKNIILNGYPYKNSQLGVDEKQGYTATQEAIYCILNERDLNNYQAINDRGIEVLNAMKIIINNSNKVNTNTELLKIENTKWQEDNNKDYISTICNVTSKEDIAFYEVTTNQDAIITNLNNIETSKFSENIQFKILVPKSDIPNDIQIKIVARIQTKPIKLAESTTVAGADYAVTGVKNEIVEIQPTIIINYNEPQTQSRLLIKVQTSDTQLPIEGAQFNILNENKTIKYEKIVTDRNGEIIKDLSSGKYYIEQTKSVGEYQRYSKLIELNLNPQKETNVIINNSKKLVENINNEKETIIVTQNNKETNIINNTNTIENIDNTETINKKESIKTNTSTNTNKKTVKKLPKTGM